MPIIKTKLDNVVIIEPRVFSDDRGYFLETYQNDRYLKHGVSCLFVQDNMSYSIQNTLRGLHYQYPHDQAKLVQVIRGEVFDVAVDIRLGYPTFGQWEWVLLSAANQPPAFHP